MFRIGGQDNKWLRELMQRSVKPCNKLLVLKTNPRSIKKPRACDPRLYRFNFPPLPVFSKERSRFAIFVRTLLTWIVNRVSESYCRGFCIKQVLRYEVLEEIHRNGN